MRGWAGALMLVACAHAPAPLPAQADADVALVTLEGHPVQLAQVRKRVTVIALWGTFCEPCLEELPLLDRLAQSYRNDRDVVVLAVAIDGLEEIDKVRETAARLHLTMPVLLDRDGALSKRLQPREDQQILPLTATIAADFGVERNVGFRPMSAARFVAEARERVERARKRSVSPGTR